MVKTWPSLKLLDTATGASLKISGTELRLPWSRSYDRFAISRKSNWTIYSDTDFLSSPTCLMHSADDEVTEFKDGVALEVGSIKLGCSKEFKINGNTSKASSTARPRPSSSGRPPVQYSTTLVNTVAPDPTTTQPSSTTRNREGKKYDFDLEGYARSTTQRSTGATRKDDTRTEYSNGDFSTTPASQVQTNPDGFGYMDQSTENIVGNTKFPRPNRPIYRSTTTTESAIVSEGILSTGSARGNLNENTFGSRGTTSGYRDSTTNPESANEIIVTTNSAKGTLSLGSGKTSSTNTYSGPTTEIPIVDEIYNSTNNKGPGSLGLSTVQTRPSPIYRGPTKEPTVTNELIGSTNFGGGNFRQTTVRMRTTGGYRRPTTETSVVDEIIRSTNVGNGNLAVNPMRSTESSGINEIVFSTNSGIGNLGSNAMRPTEPSGIEEIVLSANSGIGKLGANAVRSTESSGIDEILVSTSSTRGNSLNYNVGPGARTTNGPLINDSVNLKNSSREGKFLGSTDTDRSSTTKKPINDTSENELTAETEEAAKIIVGENDEDIRTSTAGIFFIAFLVTLCILIVAMIVAIFVCIYLNVTRRDETDLVH